jgi:hypothetical protein
LFPAAPLPLIQDAARQVLAALRDTLGCLAETADTGETPGREWALAAGQRIQTQLAGLHQARSAALQVASLAPRRWPQRSRVRRASAQAAPLDLLAASVVCLAHVGTAESAAGQRYSRAPREALGELTLAFAALAEEGDADGTRAASHASRARTALAADAARTRDPHAQLTAMLVEACADDTLRLADMRDISLQNGSVFSVRRSFAMLVAHLFALTDVPELQPLVIFIRAMNYLKLLPPCRARE